MDIDITDDILNDEELLKERIKTDEICHDLSKVLSKHAYTDFEIKISLNKKITVKANYVKC